MLRASAILAVLTGAMLAILEARANWGDWQWWPWWLVDFVAGALLIVGGWKVLCRSVDGRAWLAAGWAFTLGMAWMSLAGNVEAGPDPARNARLGGGYLLLVGALVATSVVGLLMALFGRTDVQSKK